MKIFNTKENFTMFALDCEKSEKTIWEEVGCNLYFNMFLFCILLLIIFFFILFILL